MAQGAQADTAATQAASDFMIDGPLDCPERVDAAHANMKRLGVYWVIQQGVEPPIHIDNWREREKLRLEYERQREGAR